MKKGVDYIGVTVVFYCHDGKGNLLLQKRSQNCKDEKGRWDCGGGSVEVGESFEEAVKREIMEEYCAVPKSLQFTGVNNVIRDNEGEKTHWVALLFSAELDRKKVKIGDPEKIDEINWFSINNLPQPQHSMLLTHLNFVKKAGTI